MMDILKKAETLSSVWKTDEAGIDNRTISVEYGRKGNASDNLKKADLTAENKQLAKDRFVQVLEEIFPLTQTASDNELTQELDETMIPPPVNDRSLFPHHDQWESLKQQGAEHYKTGGIELIDLLRATVPHKSLTVLDCKGLADVMKYAHRCLTRGILTSDLDKIIHYVKLIKADKEDAG